MFYLFCHEISDISRPITVKLPRDQYLGVLCNASPKIPWSPTEFCTKRCKIWVTFTHLKTLNVSISGTSKYTKSKRCNRGRFLPHPQKPNFSNIFHFHAKTVGHIPQNLIQLFVMSRALKCMFQPTLQGGWRGWTTAPNFMQAQYI